MRHLIEIVIVAHGPSAGARDRAPRLQFTTSLAWGWGQGETTLLEKHEREKKRKAGIPCTSRGRLAAALDARGAVMGAVGGIAFAVLVWRCLPRASAGAVLPLALAAWLAVSGLLWYVRKHHRWRRRARG